MPGAKLVSTRRGPWVRGANSVIDAMTLGGITLDHEIYFERVVPYKSFLDQGGTSIVDAIGVTIDNVINAGSAIGAAFEQDTDASGLLKNFMSFTISVTSSVTGSELTNTVLIPMQTVVDGELPGVQSILTDATQTLADSVSR